MDEVVRKINYDGDETQDMIYELLDEVWKIVIYVYVYVYDGWRGDIVRCPLLAANHQLPKYKPAPTETQQHSASDCLLLFQCAAAIHSLPI